MSLYRWDELPEEKVTEKLSRKLIVGEKGMLALINLKRGCIVPNHKHVNEQMAWILKGALLFTINGKEIMVREGEVLHIPPNLEHSAVATEDTVDIDFFVPVRDDWLTGKDYYLRQAVSEEKK